MEAKFFFNTDCLDKDETFFISDHGHENLMKIYDPENPTKHVLWTNDYEIELPVRMSLQGPSGRVPYTMIDSFQNAVRNYSDNIALCVKKNDKWIKWTYKDYYRDALRLGKTLIALKITQMKAVNIVGFNAPEWAISFYGSIMANILPVGIYTSNTEDACFYITDHSEAQVVIVDKCDQLQKYLNIWDKLPNLKYVVVYNDKIPYDKIDPKRSKQIKTFDEFLDLYKYQKDVSQIELSKEIVDRMKKQKPGNCCTLVYTSGTTGQPKGVMLSHDNYTWTAEQVCRDFNSIEGKERFVSFLPLSHVACQMQDLVGAVYTCSEVWYADETALKGSLIKTLQEAEPTVFFSVPRVWEKMQEKMLTIASKKGKVVKWMGSWAKGIGQEGTLAEIRGESVPWGWWLASNLVYSTVKQKLGLGKARYLVYGASQLNPSVRKYFLSLNMFLINAYGMSETSGPHTIHFPTDKPFDVRSAGEPFTGAQLKIYKPNKEGVGEICMRGRNRFMGYYKNETETQKAIDQEGWLHSGDLGRIEKTGELRITGRIKELLVTAGGENIAPILIENVILENMPYLDKAIVVGDFQKFTVILLTLKVEVDENGTPTDILTEMAQNIITQEGCEKVTTITEAIQSEKLRQIIEFQVQQSNLKAVSKAQQVKKWVILPQSFSVNGGELTPTLKLKRSVIQKKWEKIIIKLYGKAWVQY